jgi:hypothetical protein
VTWVERHLPSGSKVYTYPVNTRLEAAIINADLDGGGVDETVVVYTTRKPTAEEGTLTLMLGVLTSGGDKRALRLQASTALAGEIFFNPQIEGIGPRFAARSVTGRNRPEIIALSGTGASVRGALQVFSYDRSGLTEAARIGGYSGCEVLAGESLLSSLREGGWTKSLACMNLRETNSRRRVEPKGDSQT